MRIFIPVHWLTDFGGLHENVFDTVAAYHARGWHCTVMAPSARFNKRFQDIGASVIEHDMADIGDAIRVAIRAGSYDVVHAHPFQALAVGEGVATAMDIPIALTIHGQYLDKIHPGIDAIICVSEHIGTYIASQFPEIADRISVISNTFDDEIFKPSDYQNDYPEKHPYNVSVCSRIDPDKDTLMRCVIDLAEILSGESRASELRILGDTFYGEVNAFRDRLEKLSHDNFSVRWMGWHADRASLADALRKSDLIIGSGRAAMEAIACMRPTIAVASRGYVGLIDEASLSLGLCTNFGGVLEDATLYSKTRLATDLARAEDMDLATRTAVRDSLIESNGTLVIADRAVSLIESVATSTPARRDALQSSTMLIGRANIDEEPDAAMASAYDSVTPDERIAWMRNFSQELIKYIGNNLNRDPSVNFLGGDIAEDLLRKTERAASGDSTGFGVFENAQLQELAFWRYVAFAGYAGEDPRAFPLRQEMFMIETFWRTGWSLNSLNNSKILEVGCGPLGMTEFLPVKSGIALDPLNDQYSILFDNFRSKKIQHVTGFGAFDDEDFDFMVCHNVIDHTDQPATLFNSAFDRLVLGGRFLFQVNLSHPSTFRTDTHKSMHPSPFLLEQIQDWLSTKSSDFKFHKEDSASADGEFYFLAWGTKDRNDAVSYDKRV